MAQATRTPKEETPERDTKRVVLKRERVLIVTEAITDETLKAVQKVLREADKSASNGALAEAWTVIGEFDGDTKNRAIEAHAGKPNTPDAKPGAYKAPTVSAFAGGRVYERPPAPKVEARDLD